jgi:hypothetical protein
MVTRARPTISRRTTLTIIIGVTSPHGVISDAAER